MAVPRNGQAARSGQPESRAGAGDVGVLYIELIRADAHGISVAGNAEIQVGIGNGNLTAKDSN